MREGLIPTILGTAVVASGITMERKIMRKTQMANLLPFITAGVIGFGLAHIVLGSIDLVADRKE